MAEKTQARLHKIYGLDGHAMMGAEVNSKTNAKRFFRI
jgi:hypothetical protein